MSNKATGWQKLQALASLVSAAAIALGGIIAYRQLSDIREVFRLESALSYCNLYLSNETINDFASDTLAFSNRIEKENEGIFQKGVSYDQIIQRREKVKYSISGTERRSFLQLANYFTHAIDGVKKRMFDESIIRSCLSEQIICFREKYHVRLAGIFDEDDEMMMKWREFIAEGDAPASRCSIATKEKW